MKDNNGDISIKEAMDELLETSIFKNITKRNDERFTKKLAIWLIRYILVISSMKESLRIDLESVLLNIHGEKFRKIHRDYREIIS
ncbi:hypothetical protein MBGDC06_00169 [Thermoplasmatales archaeon SCGC AB-539-C06]|nr:hypothetical protein MBGDC06_00169 [Thermoplasmatales archaeon SCGC AB-539-C06]